MMGYKVISLSSFDLHILCLKIYCRNVANYSQWEIYFLPSILAKTLTLILRKKYSLVLNRLALFHRH